MGGFWSSKGVDNINKYCKTTGWILIVLGFIHLILSGILSAWWGVLLIILGIIILSYRSKVAIILVGIALIFVGILNIYYTIISEPTVFWPVFGILQIIWGIQELRRYSATKENPKYNKKEKRKKDYVWYSLRILFVLMIITYICDKIFINQIQNVDITIIIFCIEIIIFISSFIISIMHLVRYNKKGLAIIALLFSLIVLLLSIYGFIYGFVMGGLGDFSQEQTDNMSVYCDNLCSAQVNDTYQYYRVNYDEIKEVPLCYCLDADEKFLFEEEIPSSVYESV